MKKDTLIPAKYAKLIWLVFSLAAIVVGVVEGILIVYYGQDAKPVAVACVIATGIAGVLRWATTNSFGGGAKMLIAGALGLALVSSSSCALFQKPSVQAGLQKCAAGFVDSEVQAVMPEVLKAIQGGTTDWQAQLDGVVVKFGGAAVCALVAILQGLEGGTGGTAGAMPVVLLAPNEGGLPPAVILLRGYSYIDARR